MWGLSLPGAALLALVFDSAVSVKEALALGSLQATWVVGTPVALLWLTDLAVNGPRVSRWPASWGALIIGVILWGAIVGWWVWASRTSTPYA